MKYLQLTKQFASLVLVAALFTACDKADKVDPIGDRGQTVVKLINGGTPGLKKFAIDFVPTPTTLAVVDIRRDVANNADLNKTMNVVIKDDTAALTAYDPSIVYLPNSFYTIDNATPKVGSDGGTFSFTFQPGEVAKQINITVPDATVLDPSSTYGLAFSIVSVDADGKISDSARSVIVQIGAKNNWDGIYAVTGPMIDMVNPALVQWNNPMLGDPFTDTHGGAWELHLITTGATSCVMFDNTIWGNFYHPILNGAANSGYGTFALIVNFNPANNTVSSVSNYYAPAANTRQAALDPTGVNAVQGNKDILIKYFMLQPSLVPAPPNIRTKFDEKWEYTGPR